MLSSRDEQDLKRWFSWLLNPALFAEKQQEDPRVRKLRKAVTLLKDCCSLGKEIGECIGLAEAVLKGFGMPYRSKILTTSSGPGLGNVDLAERFCIAVGVAQLLWPDSAYGRVSKELVRQKYAIREPEAVKQRVNRFVQKAGAGYIAVAISVQWSRFKGSPSYWSDPRKWQRLWACCWSEKRGERMKWVRKTATTKRELRLLNRVFQECPKSKGTAQAPGTRLQEPPKVNPLQILAMVGVTDRLPH